MSGQRYIIAMIIAMILIGAGWLWLSWPRDIPATSLPAAVPTEAQVARFQKEAEKACICHRSSLKGCWDAYNGMTAPYTSSTLESACMPLSTKIECFTVGREISDRCVTTGYRIVDPGLREDLPICTREEAQTLEAIWAEADDAGENASDAEANAALRRADAALVAAARKIVAGHPFKRRAASRSCSR